MAIAKKKETLSLKERLEQALVQLEEQPYEVPGNWCWVKLENVYRINPKVHVIDNREAAFIPMEKISAGFGKEFSYEIQPWERAKKGHTQFVDGDVAFAKISPCFENRKSMILEQLPNGIGGGTTELIILRQPLISKEYTYWLISNDDFIKRGKSTYSGTVGQQRISMDFVRNYPVPLPPFAEQQRIVRQIESLFAKLDKAKDKLQKEIDLYQNRKDSLLYKAYSGKLTAGWRIANGIDIDSWSIVTINDIADVKGGKRVPKGMELVSEDTGQPYIKAGNLKKGTVIDDEIMYVPEEVFRYIKNYTVKTGDVYITNVGACIGDCGVIPAKYDGANLTENAVKMTNLRCDSDFLALYLETSTVQQIIKGLISSATLGKLSIANIKTIEIKLPTIEEQKEIVRKVKDVLGKEDLAKEQVIKVIQQIDLMKKSILAKAFRGELGTNHPEEESAIELLKSILSEE